MRLGRPERVRAELRPWTIVERSKTHPLYGRCEVLREEIEALRMKKRELLGTIEAKAKPTQAQVAALGMIFFPFVEFDKLTLIGQN
jgi:hypothetical protein